MQVITDTTPGGGSGRGGGGGGRGTDGENGGSSILCFQLMTNNVLSGAGKFVIIFFVYVLSRVVHHLLRRFSQPFITSDIVIGLVLGNLPFVKRDFPAAFILELDQIVDFGILCYMFVLGLEMNPYVLAKPPNRAAKLAYGSMIFSLALAGATTPWLHFSSDPDILRFTLFLAVSLSGNGSHVLTRIITNLKIGKSDIGRLATASSIHSDMLSTLILCLGFVVFPPSDPDWQTTRLRRCIITGVGVLLQILVTAIVSPIFLKWVNDENPEGKPLKGSHLVLSMAFMVALCGCSPWFGYNHIMSAFIAGLFLPSEGRISRWSISKLNYLLTALFYPFFLFYAGLRSQISACNFDLLHFSHFFLLLGIAILGKAFGIVVVGKLMNLHLPELVALGLLLTAKGHFHIYLGLYALKVNSFGHTDYLIVILVTFLTIVHIPFIVKYIIERARKRVPMHRKALQWLQPSTELRLLLGVHGAHNIPSALNFMEISRGPVAPGIVVFVTDMIQHTDEVATAAAQGEGTDVEDVVTDQSVAEMRENVTRSFQAYVDQNGEGVTLRRMLALSTFNNMAQDICALAEDLMVYLIVLPFHKRMNPDGTLDAGHSGFRYVNRKLLRNAPCSIGILVDRGLGSWESLSPSAPSLNVAVIFIGGKDDREALSYASRVTRHRGVKLTVIRFLVDKSSENAPRRVNYRVSQAEQDEEMKLDDECFADFYEKYVAGGNVAYTEKHQANSSETFMSLRSLEGQYSLIIVGRGGRVNTVLTMGLNDWQQCPELGPIGDVLSGTGFAGNTSVLIIQQHSFKGQLDGLSDEFSIM